VRRAAKVLRAELFVPQRSVAAAPAPPALAPLTRDFRRPPRPSRKPGGTRPTLRRIGDCNGKSSTPAQHDPDRTRQPNSRDSQNPNPLSNARRRPFFGALRPFAITPAAVKAYQTPAPGTRGGDSYPAGTFHAQSAVHPRDGDGDIHHDCG